VPNRPILRQESLPELALLRDNWLVIREEALALFAQGHIKAADKYNDWGFNSFFRTGWKRFYLKWYEAPLPSALANCPKTVELVNAIPTVKGAMFANLPSGGKLVQHRDPYAGSLFWCSASSPPSWRRRSPESGLRPFFCADSPCFSMRTHWSEGGDVPMRRGATSQSPLFSLCEA
jgi:beta-hydroxylase